MINILKMMKMNKLKYIRNKKGMTRKELSEKSGINIRTIEGYEQGNRDIEMAYIDTLLSLSISLECKISDLLENKNIIEKCKQARL